MTSTVVRKHKVQGDINAEWDALAPIRHQQIESGRDTSFHNVIAPAIKRLCGGRLAGAWVLDIGCGSGELTQQLAQECTRVVGVDPSQRSIEIAKCKALSSHVEFFVETIEQFADTAADRFDVAVANMVLMDCLDLDAVASAIARLLKPSSALICTITHPWNWSVYWGYHDEPWFRYDSEIIVESPFRISSEQTPVVTTHVHRPLARYVASLGAVGFVVEELLEPLPDSAEQTWAYPRYLAFRAVLRTAG